MWTMCGGNACRGKYYVQRLMRRMGYSDGKITSPTCIDPELVITLSGIWLPGRPVCPSWCCARVATEAMAGRLDGNGDVMSRDSGVYSGSTRGLSIKVSLDKRQHSRSSP